VTESTATLRERVAAELVTTILEVAQATDDTDQGADVFMPEEDEWGTIVGLARKYAAQ
jgi:hypothetical protein